MAIKQTDAVETAVVEKQTGVTTSTKDSSKPLSALRAIREYCLTRCIGSPKGVKECDDEECPNFRFRMGKHPDRAGIGVGIRDRLGRFLKKITTPADVAEKDIGKMSQFKDKAALMKPMAPSKKSQYRYLSIKKKGKISVKEVADGVVIKITND